MGKDALSLEELITAVAASGFPGKDALVRKLNKAVESLRR